MTSKIAGMYKCLKIGALICCLTICSSANGHYYATQSASTEDAIVTNEESAQDDISLQGIEQVAGLSVNDDIFAKIPAQTLATQAVVVISAASGVEAETEDSAPEIIEEPIKPAEPVVSEKYAELAITTVKADWLNIRTDASSDAEIVGKMYPGTAGKIVEEISGWTKISSGSVTGWVNNDYILKRLDAQENAEDYATQYASTDVDGLRVRSSASTESKVLGSVDVDRSYKVISVDDEWIEISFEGDSGFISAEYASTECSFGKAISIEEEQAAIAEQKRLEEERRAAEEAKKLTVQTTYGSGITLSESDVILMGAVIQFEAGGSTYDNKLAVANVLLNRLKSGKWGSTMTSVVYAKGQFSGARNGKVDSIMAAGPNGSCIQAARDALAGANNIGNIMFFCSTGIMDPSRYASYVVIGDNCFYVRP